MCPLNEDCFSPTSVISYSALRQGLQTYHQCDVSRPPCQEIAWTRTLLFQQYGFCWTFPEHLQNNVTPPDRMNGFCGLQLCATEAPLPSRFTAGSKEVWCTCQTAETESHSTVYGWRTNALENYLNIWLNYCLLNQSSGLKHSQNVFWPHGTLRRRP